MPVNGDIPHKSSCDKRKKLINNYGENKRECKVCKSEGGGDKGNFSQLRFE